MPDRSIFGEIVTRLTSSSEDIATEALCYLLRTYPSAWTSVRRLLEKSGVSFDERLAFNTQSATDDNGRPDLVGTNSDRDRVLIIEAKFWAGLTTKQPVAYLNQLPSAKPAMILVVAPALRQHTLWTKLIRVTENAGIACSETTEAANEFRVCQVNDHHQLALISWRSILAEVERDADVAGFADLKGDVIQLSGLCSKMDGESFLPLSDNDLSPNPARRILQYADLVDSAVHVLAEKQQDKTKRVNSGGRRVNYGVYFTMGGYGMYLSFNPRLWSRRAETPIWLNVKRADRPKDWSVSLKVNESLQQAFAGTRKEVFVGKQGIPWIPIHLPTGCERSEVLDSIVNQIREVAAVARASGEVHEPPASETEAI
ncbi:hypothetical protein NZK35_23160 [Stieleria sp. ICT_E10.1]|uniref:hypothetical protein n=1 Tax=Stieleria sedimenti TaxID=2976331 RepID=UPI00217F37DB|nr:hypothetical protein [Stieleria sedimenti]MCS7469562.1 hypothetical protein [Stieleria sedimenti]